MLKLKALREKQQKEAQAKGKPASSSKAAESKDEESGSVFSLKKDRTKGKSRRANAAMLRIQKGSIHYHIPFT